MCARVGNGPFQHGIPRGSREVMAARCQPKVRGLRPKHGRWEVSTHLWKQKTTWHSTAAILRSRGRGDSGRDQAVDQDQLLGGEVGNLECLSRPRRARICRHLEKKNSRETPAASVDRLTAMHWLDHVVAYIPTHARARRLDHVVASYPRMPAHAALTTWSFLTYACPRTPPPVAGSLTSVNP